MSTRVRVPIEITLEGFVPGDPASPARVHDALREATAQAMQAVPLERMGVRAPGDIRLDEVTIASAVEPSGTPNVATAEVLAAACAGATAGAQEAMQGLLTTSPARSARVDLEAGERFDPSRRRHRNGRTTYRIPFYDGGEAEVPLDEGDTADAEAERALAPPVPTPGDVINLDDALNVAWSWHVYRNGPRWEPGALGYPGYYGKVRISGRARSALVWITEVRGAIPESGEVAGGSVSYLWWPMVVLEPEKDSDRIRRARVTPSLGGYELTSSGEVASVELIEAELDRLVAGGGYSSDFPLRDPERKREYAEALLADQGTTEDSMLWTLRGPREMVSVLPRAIAGSTINGPIRFVTADATPSSDEESNAATRGAGRGIGEGRGGGRGRGAGRVQERPHSEGRRGGEGGEGTRRRRRIAGGPLGTSTATGSVWPRADTDSGETMQCTPFLAEPAAAALVDDYGLFVRMRRIAALLEITECQYLGRFGLKAATMIATRARGIGLAAVRATSTTMVTFRPDGDGNNAFLDVRPGASPDFEYLRALAGLAAEVSAYCAEVISCYLDPRNAALIRVDEDYDPSPAGWALRFSGERQDYLRHGYMHLYAETCRALLLQQLRSSREGIVARRDDKFVETVQGFASALDILGEPVVQLSTLARTISHAAKVHSRSGTVREVLSIAQTVSYGPDTEVTLPPPIDSVPQRILDVVGDARMETRGSSRVIIFSGREWTKEQLQIGVNTRRGLLNQIDPLFMQVANLDSLFAGAERDEDHVERFLRDLLREMFEANVGMIKESSDPDDGAFFALEASKYVERTGGRDWRGLRFELQGIHKLADEQLAPSVYHDGFYILGVNAAIERKAGFDAFVALFSTIGIIALGLLCAPLGALAAAAIVGAAGLALTIHDVMEADRQEDLYRSVLNPEMFLRWQEVQLAKMMATLSIAFSVFDVVPVGRAARAIVGTASHALRVGQRAGTRLAVASVGRAARREIIESMTREVLEKAVQQAIAEAAIVAAMNRLLPIVITPVLVPWMRQQAAEHGTLDEVDQALGPLAEGQPALRTEPMVSLPAESVSGQVP